MSVTIRRVAVDASWRADLRQLSVEGLSQVISVAAVRAACQQARRPSQRVRKLSAELTVWVLIALGVFPHMSLAGVLRQVTQGVRLRWLDVTPTRALLASASALSYRRQQLGGQPLVALFHAICQPLATPATLPSAFAFGLRVVALDGTVENLPDSPANQRAFGRRASQRGRSVYPQVLGVALVECATHAIFEVGVWPATTSEHRAAPRLLRAVTPGMLLLWDRGFHSLALLRAVQARGAHALGRLPAHVQPRLVALLADGSALVDLQPGGAPRQDPTARLRVRLLTYQLGGGATAKTYRLVTTLLDPAQAPAADLATLYHQRWAVEECFGELDTRLRWSAQTLRSQTPLGVIQELYALLLAHYALRALMYQAAVATQQEPRRLSFVHCLRVLREATLDLHLLPRSRWSLRWTRILDDLAHARLPPKRVRANPRVVKRRTSKYPQKPSGLGRGVAAPTTGGWTLIPLAVSLDTLS